MQATDGGRAFGLPKELVAALLVVALVVTVAVDVAATPPPRRVASRVVAVGVVPDASVPSTTAPPPAPATTAPAPTTTTPPPPPPTTATRPAPSPAPRRPAPPPPASPPPALPPGAARVALGAYVGAANPSGLASFATSTGTHPTYASDFLPGNGGWAGMTTASSLSWLTGAWRGSGRVLILGVPMIPTDSGGNPLGTLAAGAAGQYDAQFVTLANTLVSGGEGNAVLRLGWEFNGNWFPWSVSSTSDAANYATYFRNIVAAMRSVPGQSFKFVWNPNGGGGPASSPYPQAAAYPGNAYVDYIGSDLYDQTWASPPTPQNAWAAQLAGAWSLTWLASFAAAQGRPIVFPEWGEAVRSDGHGMGDDPYYIQQFGAWIASHPVAWTSYFNFDAPDGTHDLFDSAFSQSLSAFRAVFG